MSGRTLAEGDAHRRHMLYAGWVMGLALRNGLPVDPVLDEEGNYTDRLAVRLARPGSRVALSVEIVVPPPPDDWELT